LISKDALRATFPGTAARYRVDGGWVGFSLLTVFDLLQIILNKNILYTQAPLKGYLQFDNYEMATP
jgi:hypothetical protein